MLKKTLTVLLFIATVLMIFSDKCFAQQVKHRCTMMIFSKKPDYQNWNEWRYKTTWMCNNEQLYVIDDKDVYDRATEDAWLTTEVVGGVESITCFEAISPPDKHKNSKND